MYLYLSLNVFRFFPVSQPIVFYKNHNRWFKSDLGERLRATYERPNIGAGLGGLSSKKVFQMIYITFL